MGADIEAERLYMGGSPYSYRLLSCETRYWAHQPWRWFPGKQRRSVTQERLQYGNTLSVKWWLLSTFLGHAQELTFGSSFLSAEEDQHTR